MDVAKKRDREWVTYREFRSCKSKLIHHNYLEAILHARAIEHHIRKGQTIHIYPCEYCTGIHIGWSGRVPKTLTRLRHSIRRIDKIIANEGFQAKASEEVKQHMLRCLENLVLRLQEYENEIQLFKDADLEGNAVVEGALHGARPFQSRP